MWLINLTSSQNENKFDLPGQCSLKVFSCLYSVLFYFHLEVSSFCIVGLFTNRER